MSYRRVSALELNAFVREHRRLVELGDAATYGEALAYHRQKAELFQRIAANPDGLVDADDAVDAAKTASKRFKSMLRHPLRPGGTS